MPMIELTHATKTFKHFTALNDVSLTVDTGTILCLIGPSGAGKSTLVKCLMGMEKLTQGTSRVLETEMPNRAILKRIGYLAQEDALYEELTGKENLVFFGQMMGFIPLVVVPQIFFAGIIPLDTMAHWVQTIGKFLPLSYAGDALTNVMYKGQDFDTIAVDLAILVLFALVFTIANILGLRKYRKV